MKIAGDRLAFVAAVVFILVLWAGFLIHQSRDFAGSLAGTTFAIAGSLLMLLPLAYPIVKRFPSVRHRVQGRHSMAHLLQVHTCAGYGATILVLIHTGHKFQSTLGVLLTAMVLLVVLSGFVGRYLLRFVVEDIRDRRSRLETLRAEYQQRAAECSRIEVAGLRNLGASDASTNGLRALIESIADLEYAVIADERIRRMLSYWLGLHIFGSVLLYGLLALHVWAAFEFGFRWLS